MAFLGLRDIPRSQLESSCPSYADGLSMAGFMEGARDSDPGLSSNHLFLFFSATCVICNSFIDNNTITLVAPNNFLNPKHCTVSYLTEPP